jgi:MYXO-CTERM domain-containing protein
MKRFFGMIPLTMVVLSPAVARAGEVPVKTTTELTAAVAAAQPGDTIVLASGTYAFTGGGRAFTASAAGTAAAPITVRSATPLGAKLTFDTLEGIVVEGPFWRFEGLDIQGVCASDSDCEHAFHVVGQATDVVLRGNRLVDFNAQLKVNTSLPAKDTPHRGLVEGNDIHDTHGRQTSNPVTKLNIDTGDDWVVRANSIHDYFKDGGDGVSYGIFLKGGGQRGLVERNLVLCERDLPGGTRIGLSFGGGGTGAQYCSPAFDAGVPCSIEHQDGVMRNNIIAHCSDVGIYLNRSKNTKVLNNTLVDTSGIDFRFETTSGVADGNVFAGKIHDRDGGTHTAGVNLAEVSSFADWYLAPEIGDLRKKGDLSSLLGKASASPDVPDDYCARARSGMRDLGALQASLGDCDTTTPPLSGEPGGSGGAAGQGQGGSGVSGQGQAGSATAGSGQGGSAAGSGPGGGNAGGKAGGAAGSGSAGKAGANAAGSGLSGHGQAGGGAAGNKAGGAGQSAEAIEGNDVVDETPSGCGCRVASGGSDRRGLVGLALLAGLAGLVRRQGRSRRLPRQS